MALRRWIACLAVVAAACGGDRARDTARTDTTPKKSDSSTVAVSGEWPAALGVALVMPSDTENTAVLLHPAGERATVDKTARFTLLAPNGETIRTNISATIDSAHCGDAPIARLSRASPLVWTLGLTGGTAQVVRSDSLESLSHDDSSTFTIASARLASAVAAGTTSRLAGLRFVVTGLRRIERGDTTIIASQLVRRVNQEANPAEERTMIIAERVGDNGEFVTVHSDRSEGTEETAAHYELIGAFRTATSLYLIVATDAATGSMIEVLEKSGGAWQVRWTRGLGC